MKVILAFIPPLLWIAVPVAITAYFGSKGDGFYALLGGFFGFAASTVLFTIYWWFFGYKHSKDVFGDRLSMDESTIRLLMVVLCIILVPFVIFGAVNEMGMQLPTLYESELQGSSQLKHGNMMGWNKEEVNVEHPGVEHSISIWPRGDDVDENYKDVTIFLRVVDPSGKKVLDEQKVSKKADIVKVHWTPEVAGKHLFLITTVTEDVPGLHVWITDPKKNNGRRNIH